MSGDYIKGLIAKRFGGDLFNNTSEYKFTKIDRLKEEAILNNPETEMIDMGVGEPDAMADEGVIRTLTYEARKWNNRGYSNNGTQELNEAAVEYMKSFYKVENLDKIDEVNHVIGSKSALSMIAQIFINKDDIMLMTTPGYFVTATATEWLGGKVHELPLLKENDFLPDLDNIPAEILEKAKILYINYPNNPTGAVATPEFFAKVVEFAKKNNIAVVHDAAYAGLVYDETEPLSFLAVDGAKDVGIEIHSLSKSFNMTGWRIGFVVGNKDIIKALRIVKDNVDSGQFKPIQYAAKYALEHPELTIETSNKYSRRLDMMVSTLRNLGFDANKSKGSFYLYVPIPKGIKGVCKFENAEQFSEYLIKEKMIATIPWDDAGSYIRLSATFLAYGEKEERQIVDKMYDRLKDVQFEF